MAPLQNNSIKHFTHQDHPLTKIDGHDYLCDGCKTPGSGNRYRCNACNFDLHEYCGTCPRVLSSFMHKNHELTLVTRKSNKGRHANRICDVCSEPVEGLFYGCKKCDFDVHPLCTQLPEKLQHALHKDHPLNLKSSTVSGICAVCRGVCTNWRYTCGKCNFDIHLECVLVPVVPFMKNDNVQNTKRGSPAFDQGIPFRSPPQFTPYYGTPYYGPGHYHPSGPGYSMYHNQYVYPNNMMPQNQVNGAGSSSNGSGRLGWSMFSLVGQIGFGVVSNMIFGVDVSSLW